MESGGFISLGTVGNDFWLELCFLIDLQYIPFVFGISIDCALGKTEVEGHAVYQ